ncbi:MAG: tripartite tricarboxylate transporter substrate-binding protein [Beijerinckiaceae bacterium]|nr:tripartite tricarboxylate transporter substrate-binding protein [Beijerinckiaceae bacterium]
MSRIRSSVCALSCILVTGAVGQASADAIADFYTGKTISMIVASGPGGGYDLYARTLSRHYPRNIPGNPNVVIQYAPGGGGIVAANNVYGLARRDGTGMGMLASSTFLLAAVGDANTKFENLKFTFIGNMNEEVDTCSVWHTTGIKSAEDIKSREVIIGTAGPGSNSQTFPLAMNSALGMKFKAIPGYQGGAQIRTTAMERGELQGTCGIFVSTLNAQFPQQLAEGKLKVVLQMGLSRHPAYKDVPNALEMANDQKGRAALELLFAQLALGRPVLGPPDIPADRAAALQKAFDVTMNDPQFRAEAEKTRVELRWFDAARMKDVMERMEAAPIAVKEDVRKLLNVK